MVNARAYELRNREAAVQAAITDSNNFEFIAIRVVLGFYPSFLFTIQAEYHQGAVNGSVLLCSLDISGSSPIRKLTVLLFPTRLFCGDNASSALLFHSTGQGRLYGHCADHDNSCSHCISRDHHQMVQREVPLWRSLHYTNCWEKLLQRER